MQCFISKNALLIKILVKMQILLSHEFKLFTQDMAISIKVSDKLYKEHSLHRHYLINVKSFSG